MIALYTDFGAGDIYVGQMKAAILARHPAATVIDLLHDAPRFSIAPGAHLLAALVQRFERGTVSVAVVDPGVGTDRDAVVVQADERWYVGPDNGLLSVIAARASQRRTWRIVWRPRELSTSFHGRDLFAPIAADLDRGEFPQDKLEPIDALRVRLGAGDLAEVIHVDRYGNAITGLRARNVDRDATMRVRDRALRRADVFAAVAEGDVFWYENSIGLVEIAANRASAADLLGVRIGDPIETSRAN
jgi:S-adenosylmethionine hydrolase